MNSRVLTLIVVALAVVAACSPEDVPVEQQIEKLRQERASIDGKIRELETKLQTADGSATGVPVTRIVTALAPFQHIIEVKGSVDSRSTITVSPEVGGRITKLNVSNGQTVKQGQLLLEVDAEILKRNLEEVETQLEFARTMYEKQKRIYEQKAGSEIQYLQAKNTLESLEKRHETLSEQVAKSRIVAATSGTIDNLVPSLGEMISPGMPLMTIVNTSDMRVIVDLAESYIKTVDAGDEVVIQFPELSDTIRTRIATVSKTVNPVNRTFRVEIPLHKVPARLTPNTTCTVIIYDQTLKDALTIPLASIVRDGEKQWVFVIDSVGRVHRSEITTDLVSNGTANVRSGLAQGQSVVVRGVQQIVDGQAVRVIE